MSSKKITREEFEFMIQNLEDAIDNMKKDASNESNPMIPADAMFIILDEVVKMLNNVKDNYECK